MIETANPIPPASLLEGIEAEAWADLFRGASDAFKQEHRVVVTPIGGALLAQLGTVDHPQLNRVFCLGLQEEATEHQLDHMLAAYQKAGIQNAHFYLAPGARPAALQSWLAARGLVEQGAFYKMYRGTEAPKEGSSTLRVVPLSSGQGEIFGQTSCAAFGMPDFLGAWAQAGVGRPGWRHYLTLDGDRPVGTGALFAKGGVGWLGMASTLESHRGRGGQAALLARRIQDAIALGCRVLVSETEVPAAGSSPSLDNLRRAGFQLAYERKSFGAGGA